MGAHALLSASSGYRWTVCTKAPHFEAQFPDTSSWAAQEGTIAHAIGEYCLLTGSDADEVTAVEVPLISELVKHHVDEGNDWEIELLSMQKYVQEYVDYVNTIPGERYYEQRVDFSHLVPEGFGTSDVITLNGDVADIIDLKFGKGKKVFADGVQMRLYALGALNDLGFIFDQVKTIRMHIKQPRLDWVDVHEVTIEELNKYGQWIKGRAELAYSNQGDFVAGDHCDFCRARKVCKARADANLKMATEEFGEECPSSDRLTTDQIASILPRLDNFLKWAKELDEYALETALAGTHYTGYKVVEGRSTRKWADENAVVAAMRAEGLADDQIYNMKLVGMTEAEKLLGKKSDVFALAVRSPGKPTLVPESDKRMELSQATVHDDFGTPVEA